MYKEKKFIKGNIVVFCNRGWKFVVLKGLFGVVDKDGKNIN